jgi:hypothetical protein
MFGIVLVGVLDTKIIDNECERNVSGVVLPESRCYSDRCVAVRLEEFREAIVSDASSLRETVHAFANFTVDGSVVDKASKVVLDHNGFGYDRFLGEKRQRCEGT